LAVALRDCEGRYLAVNSDFEQVAGLRRDKIHGLTDRDVSSFWSEALLREFRRRDHAVISSKSTITHERDFVCADGTARSWAITRFPVFGADGEVVAVGMAIADIACRESGEFLRSAPPTRSRVLARLAAGVSIESILDEPTVEVGAPPASHKRAVSAPALPVVLLVDDEEMVRKALQRRLADGGAYRVLSVGDAASALDLLSREAVDVVIADQNMPGMKGTDMLARVAAEHPDTVRILLTAYATLDVAKSGINQAGIYRLLEKPEEMLNVLEVVNAALESRGAATEVGETNPNDDALAALSPREREVVDLLLKGRRVNHIAKHMALSHHTVRNHLRRVFSKLSVNSQTELIERYAPSV
jgi:PAS domain S-box-containing protein